MRSEFDQVNLISENFSIHIINQIRKAEKEAELAWSDYKLSKYSMQGSEPW